MKKIALFATLLCLIGCMSLYAQGGTVDVPLDATNHGTTMSTTSGTIVFLYDEGGPNGPYTGGSDYFMSFTGDCESLDSTHSTHLSIIIHAGYDIGCEDTLYVYDGPDTNSPVLVKFNNCFTSAEGSLFTITPDNYLTRGGVLTVRFRTHLNEERHAGFFCEFECRKPCESIVAYIDKEYDRTTNTEQSSVQTPHVWFHNHSIPSSLKTLLLLMIPYGRIAPRLSWFHAILSSIQIASSALTPSVGSKVLSFAKVKALFSTVMLNTLTAQDGTLPPTPPLCSNGTLQ